MKLRSDVKQLIQRSHWEVNTTEPRKNNSYKTKKNFTGFYTEDDPKYLKNRPLRNTLKRFLRRKHFSLSLCQQRTRQEGYRSFTSPKIGSVSPANSGFSRPHATLRRERNHCERQSRPQSSSAHDCTRKHWGRECAKDCLPIQWACASTWRPPQNIWLNCILITHLGRFLVNLDVPLHRRRSRGSYVPPPHTHTHTHVLVPKNTFTDVVEYLWHQRLQSTHFLPSDDAQWSRNA